MCPHGLWSEFLQVEFRAQYPTPLGTPGGQLTRELKLAFQISCTDSTFHRLGGLGDSEDNIQAEQALVPVVHAFPQLVPTQGCSGRS